MQKPVLHALLWSLSLVAASAFADGRICTTQDVLLFGNVITGTAPTQSSVVTNCGNAPWSFTDVSIHPATASAYHVATTCTTGRMLAPAESCRIDVTFAPVIPGQASGGVWLHNTTITPDQIVTFYGRGVDAQAGSAVLEFVPASLSFGAQTVGTPSALQTVTLRNLGPSTLTLRALVLNGPDALDFRAPGNCAIGIPIPAGGACELYFNFTPAAVGTRTAQLNVDAPELANLAIMPIVGFGVATFAPTVDVIEFYNAPLDHYFLTAVAEEAAAIDQGLVGPHWQRTGQSFRAFPAGTATGSAFDVCRFWGTPANPRWVYEGIAFGAILPVAGLCPPATEPVIRFFWPGAEVTQSRHRYVRDTAELVRMRAALWIEEGPVFCGG
jgi:hypothetical protein